MDGNDVNSVLKQESKSIICDQCAGNGVPNQKVVLVYLGIRPASEPGFIYKFQIYDYSDNGDKKIHRHKYDPEVIDRLVDAALNQRKVIAR